MFFGGALIQIQAARAPRVGPDIAHHAPSPGDVHVLFMGQNKTFFLYGYGDDDEKVKFFWLSVKEI